MKMIKKAMTLGFGLMIMGSAAFAQNLADAKKAIDAEQYQKASGILKSLTASQPKKGENYFYLGNVYLKTDDIDSAKVVFTNGTIAEPKFALNYVGLGNVELLNKNTSAAQAQFDKALSFGAKDYKTHLFIGKALISTPTPDFNNSLAYLEKADELDAKDLDEEVFIALGDYYALQKLNSNALKPYLRSISINPNNLRPIVQTGRMYTRAYNFADAENKLKQAIETDPNYGPAYRELAETQMEWSRSDVKRTKELQASALENYRKYLNLTDKSFDSRLRYAQFLVYVNDFQTLDEVATGLAADNKNPSKDLLIARLRGYAAYETEKFDQSIANLKVVFEKGKSEPGRIQPSDYAYYGKALMQTNQDSLAFINIKQAVALDSTLSDELVEIGKKFNTARRFDLAAEAYGIAAESNSASPSVLTNYFRAASSLVTHYRVLVAANKPADKALLAKADKYYDVVIKLAPDFESTYLSRAAVAKLMEENPTAPVGLAKPYYEKFVELVTVTKPESAQNHVKGLVEAYGYLAYLLMDTEPEKSIEYFNKVLSLEPDNKYAADNIKYLNSVQQQKKSPNK